jgi:hypothetical protein
MRKMLLLLGGTALTIASFSPASALLSNQAAVSAAQAQLDDVVQVKRSKAKRRPPGWSRGRAVWKRGGRGVPPGQR